MSAAIATAQELGDLEGAPDAASADDASSADLEATEATARLATVLDPPARILRATEPSPAPTPLAGTAQAVALTAARRAATRSLVAGRTDSIDATSPLPDPTAMCCSMVQAAVEALRGARPLAQLARWVTPEIYEQLELRAELTRRAHGESAGTRRAVIRRIRLCRLGDRTAEASVVVDDGARVRAVAIRLEGHRGQWRAMALVIG